jgi:hypothetical protein
LRWPHWQRPPSVTVADTLALVLSTGPRAVDRASTRTVGWFSAASKAAHRVSSRKRRSTLASRSSVQATRWTACPVVPPSVQTRWAPQGSTGTSRGSPRDKMELSQIVLTQPKLSPCQFPWMGKCLSHNVGRPIRCICSSHSGMSSTRSVMMFGIACMPRA